MLSAMVRAQSKHRSKYRRSLSDVGVGLFGHVISHDLNFTSDILNMVFDHSTSKEQCSYS